MYKVDNMMVDYHTNDIQMCMRISTKSFMEESNDALLYPSFSEREVEENQDLLANIPSYKYERYLLLFNDWFMKNGKLPIITEQLQYMGIDEYQSIYNIDDFIKALYEICDDKSALDEEFIDYLEDNIKQPQQL